MKILTVTNMYPTPVEPQYGCFVKEQVEDLRRAGVEIDVLPFDGRSRRITYMNAAREVRRRTRMDGYDIVHAHYGLSGVVARTQWRYPVVTTFHGSDVGFIRWQRRVSWLVARLTRPVFVSRHLAAMLGMANADVVPTPVDTDLFAPMPRAEARRRLGWQPKRTYVLFPSSRLNQVKDPQLFDSVVATIRRRVTAVEPVSLERLSRQEVALVMNASDVTVLTSRSEGSPVAVKESLACETPVVAAAVGDVPDVLAGLPGCSIRSRDAVSLAEGVKEALEGGRRPELRQRALEFSRQVIANRMIDVFTRVLAER